MRFDPIEYAKQLRNVGVSQEQADVHAQTMEHALDCVINDNSLATKADIYLVKRDLLVTKTELKSEISDVRLEIERLRYATLKFTIWTGVGVVATLTGSMYGMLKSMLPHIG